MTGHRLAVDFQRLDLRPQAIFRGERGIALRPTVFVKSVCGQVPHRKFLQTLSSDHWILAFASPIASGPIICYNTRRATNSNKTLVSFPKPQKINNFNSPTSKSFLCISASRPIVFKKEMNRRNLRVSSRLLTCLFLFRTMLTNPHLTWCETHVRVFIVIISSKITHCWFHNSKWKSCHSRRQISYPFFIAWQW